MHEMSLVRDLVDVAVRAAQKNNAQCVKVINLTIGMGRDVIPELFNDLFKHLSKGTLAEGAEISITNNPYLVRCRDCGMTYHIDVFNHATWNCPRCEARTYDVVSGMEFSIDTIEVM